MASAQKKTDTRVITMKCTVSNHCNAFFAMSTESCPLTNLNGGLSRLHSADEDAVSWLTTDQLWFITRIREEEWRLISATLCGWRRCFVADHWPVMVHYTHTRRRMAAYLGYTLRMKTLFRGWPVMVNDTLTRRRRYNIGTWQTDRTATSILRISTAAPTSTTAKNITYNHASSTARSAQQT